MVACMELKKLELVCYRMKLKPDSIEKVRHWGYIQFFWVTPEEMAFF